MVIGWVNDAPTPVLEIVSGADVTTEVSVVGKASDEAMPVTLGVGAEAAPVADETTDVSSVGNRGGALAAAGLARGVHLVCDDAELPYHRPPLSKAFLKDDTTRRAAPTEARNASASKAGMGVRC